MKDVVIIGGGPGGYVAAIRAGQLGLDTTIIEKDLVGGVCLNRGCIPTKTLLHSAEIVETIKEAGDCGINVTFTPDMIDYEKIVNRKTQVSARLRGGIEQLFKMNGVEYIKGEAKIKDAKTVVVGDQEIETKNIIIATGSSIVKPPIPGLDGENVMFSDEALELTVLPASIAVVGGGVIGIEFACLFSSMGVKVTVVEFLPRIAATADSDISAEMQKQLKRRGVTVMTSTKVCEIKPGAIVVEANGETKEIECEKVLVCTGRRANVTGFGAEELGIATEKRGITVDDYCETNIPNVYAIGDVNGKLMLAHKASEDGIVVVENIAAGKKVHSCKDMVVPSCIYGSPEIAQVGKTEDQLKDEGVAYIVGRFDYMASGKAQAENAPKGFIKVLVAEDDHKVLGVHVIGKHACEMIMEATVAITNKLTAEQVIASVHPHPSVSEIFSEAFNNAFKRAIHTRN